MARLEEIRASLSDRADLHIVYIKEAHASDVWPHDANEGASVLADPRSLAERLEVANTFVTAMDVKAETVVDAPSDAALSAYAAWPERIYVVDAEGRVAYKGGIGPFYFEPEEILTGLPQ